jgi:hypothetical protein
MVLLKLNTMKKLIYTTILAFLLTGGSAMRAQERPEEYLGLPGDNLNLYAVMKLFQESETLEGFERKLNEENSRINNLDLNGDNQVDYITVSDYTEGNVHTIVLRTALSRRETQDIAVFTVEKLRNGEVRIQLIGDEALYGRDYIIEPNYAETPNPGYMGRPSNVTVVTTTYYEVSAWPVVRFIFLPSYIVWRSAWYWDYYPVYWHPWHPCYWHYYYGYHYNWYPNYYQYYRHAPHVHYAYYHDHYYNHMRTYSPTVNTRIREGNYRATYSHPESRREGEALYTRTNPGRTTRTQTGITNGTETRRVSSQPADNRRTTLSGTGNERRSNDYMAERTRQGSSSVQNNGTVRRPSTTSTGRTTTTRPPEQHATTSRRPNTGSDQGSSARPVTTQRSGSPSRSSSPAEVHRPAANNSVSHHESNSHKSVPQVSQRSSSRSSANISHSAPSRQSGSSGNRSVSHSSNSRSTGNAGRSSSSRSIGSGSTHRR